MLVALTGPLRKKFFLVPLQVSGDSQVVQHSGFDSVEGFVRHVVASFAAHAPGDTTLVIKHHPFDRGYYDYGPLIRQQGHQLGIADRLLYVHDQHLPTLFDHMRGAIVINSTVGCSALSHGAPVKACGGAIYDIEGLTFQGSLDNFWRAAEHFRPDRELFRRFRAYVIAQTQISGSFYRGRLDEGLCASMTTLMHGYQARRSSRRLPTELAISQHYSDRRALGDAAHPASPHRLRA